MKLLRHLVPVLKVLALLFVGYMGYMQVPELAYDFGPSTPLVIGSPTELDAAGISGVRFVSLEGEGDFSQAFVYRRYGLDMHYFTIAPYGKRVVVRTYDKITDEWSKMKYFIGRLRPFEKQPFSQYVEAIYKERFGESIPPDAYFMALGDVPHPSGWQVGGAILALAMWLALFYLFFLRGRGGRVQALKTLERRGRKP